MNFEFNPDDPHAECVQEVDRLREALEAVLLFYRGGEWDDPARARWAQITGRNEATTKILCDHIRKVLQ